jgi:hypothetical protein
MASTSDYEADRQSADRLPIWESVLPRTSLNIPPPPPRPRAAPARQDKTQVTLADHGPGLRPGPT